MIKITNLTKKFGDQVVLDNINLNIESGDKVLIMGQNGAGKTTLMKAILAQIVCQSGEVLIGGINPVKHRKKALKFLSFVPQTPPPLRLSVAEICDYAVRTYGVVLGDVERYLKEFDLDYEREKNKPFHKLSGGMKQKVLIAIALARNSQIIMFDEPTANLDPEAREKFLSLLRADFADKTLVFISHRVSEVEGLVTRTVEMDLGKIAKEGKA